MKTYLDCLPCLLSQALQSARIATDDEMKIKKVLDETGSMLKNIPIESTPPESGRLVYHKVSEITGNLDPYRKLKNERHPILFLLKAKCNVIANDIGVNKGAIVLKGWL